MKRLKLLALLVAGLGLTAGFSTGCGHYTEARTTEVRTTEREVGPGGEVRQSTEYEIQKQQTTTPTP